MWSLSPPAVHTLVALRASAYPSRPALCNISSFLLGKPLITLGHARFRAILAAESDPPLANEVADHDSILATLVDRGRCLLVPGSRLGQSGAHALLVQLLGDIFDHGAAAASAHVKSENWFVYSGLSARSPRRSRFTPAAPSAQDAPHLELHEFPRLGARSPRRQVPAHSVVSPALKWSATYNSNKET